MKKFYVFERRVSKDRRKMPRQYFDAEMSDRRKSQGTPPIIVLAELNSPLASLSPRFSTH